MKAPGAGKSRPVLDNKIWGKGKDILKACEEDMGRKDEGGRKNKGKEYRLQVRALPHE